MDKCVYLIPHTGNFTKKNGKSVIGSSTHIEIGIEQLQKYFEVEPVVIPELKANSQDQKKTKPKSPANNQDAGRSGNRLIGMFRDLRVLVKNHTHFFRTYRHLKKMKPDLIFERSEYLNFTGIISARLLGIPHFYEANWVHYNGIRQFYDSYFNSIAKRLEEKMYALSTHVFFVGNQHELLSLRKNNWSTIQNGVRLDVVKKFTGHENNITGNVINVCVLASLMKHHRIDILFEALKKLKGGSKIKLYFIGVNFDSYLSNIPPDISYEYLGALSKDKLYEKLADMNVAVISGGPFYSSFMKLYDYAAVKLAVICPELSNLKNIFSDEEILFFRNEDSDDLAQKMDYLIDHSELVKKLGNNLYRKVEQRFTWENIFFEIVSQIQKDRGARS